MVMSCCLSLFPCFRRNHAVEEATPPKSEDLKTALLAAKISQVSYNTYSPKPEPSLRTRVLTQKLKGFYTFLNSRHEEAIPLWVLSLQKLLDAPEEESLGDKKEESKNFLACLSAKTLEGVEAIASPPFESSTLMKAILSSNRDHREVLISHFFIVAQTHYYGKLSVSELIQLRFPMGYSERLWETFITEVMMHKGFVLERSLDFSGQLSNDISMEKLVNLLQNLSENRFVDNIDLSKNSITEEQLRFIKARLIGYARAPITI